jgi:hypothetical protein
MSIESCSKDQGGAFDLNTMADQSSPKLYLDPTQIRNFLSLCLPGIGCSLFAVCPDLASLLRWSQSETVYKFSPNRNTMDLFGTHNRITSSCRQQHCPVFPIRACKEAVLLPFFSR